MSSSARSAARAPTSMASCGAVEVEPADVTDARRDQDVGRIAGKARPRDAVLHDVEGVHHHGRNAGTAAAADELALERALGAEQGAQAAALGCG